MCSTLGRAPAFLPTPYGVAVGTDASGNLRPGQAGLLLEPLEALREVVGELVSLSVLLDALSRHRAGPSRGRLQSPLPDGNGLVPCQCETYG